MGIKRIFLLHFNRKEDSAQAPAREELPRAHPYPQPAPIPPVSRPVISPIRARAKAREDLRQAGDIWRRWLAAQGTERLSAPNENNEDGWLL